MFTIYVYVYIYIYIYIYNTNAIYNMKHVNTKFKAHRFKITYMQARWDVVPKLPMRSVLVGPSSSGHTVLLINMTLNIYKGCFQ